MTLRTPRVLGGSSESCLGPRSCGLPVEDRWPRGQNYLIFSEIKKKTRNIIDWDQNLYGVIK